MGEKRNIHGFPDGELQTESEVSELSNSDETDVPSQFVVAWRWLSRASKFAAAVTGVLGLLVIPISITLWIISTVDDAKAEVKREVKTVKTELKTELRSELNRLEEDTVSQDLFDEHEERFERAEERAKDERRNILQKLDVIGQRQYGSPSRWERTLQSRGLEPELKEGD